jgi:hypothetical protein
MNIARRIVSVNRNIKKKKIGPVPKLKFWNRLNRKKIQKNAIVEDNENKFEFEVGPGSFGGRGKGPCPCRGDTRP